MTKKEFINSDGAKVIQELNSQNQTIKQTIISKQYLTAVQDIEAKATVQNNTVSNQPK